METVGGAVAALSHPAEERTGHDVGTDRHVGGERLVAGEDAAAVVQGEDRPVDDQAGELHGRSSGSRDGTGAGDDEVDAAMAGGVRGRRSGVRLRQHHRLHRPHPPRPLTGRRVRPRERTRIHCRSRACIRRRPGACIYCPARTRIHPPARPRVHRSHDEHHPCGHD